MNKTTLIGFPENLTEKLIYAEGLVSLMLVHARYMYITLNDQVE